MSDDKRKTMFPPRDLNFLNPSSYSRAPKPKNDSTDGSQRISNVETSKTSTETNETVQIKPPKPNVALHERKTTSHQLKKDSPWTSYQGLVFTDETHNYVGAYHLRKRNTVRKIVQVTPPLDESWIHELLGLEHKHIVRLWEVFQTKDTFLVYEMVDISLETLIACPLTFREPQVARVCAKILQAIRYLSGRYLCHNYINTSNILVSSNGEIKLDQIHTCTRDTQSNELTTPHDIWSLGQVMLEMMEPDSAILPSYQTGDILKLSSPQNWSSAANDFLRNTTTTTHSFIDSLQKHVFLKKIDADDSTLEANLWLGYLTGMRTWAPYTK